MTTEALERRGRLLEDKDALRELMARYAHCINKGWHGKVVLLSIDLTCGRTADGWRVTSVRLLVGAIIPLQLGKQQLS